LLKAHYRSELQWSEDLLRESQKNLDDWYRTLKRLENIPKAKVDSLVLFGLSNDLQVLDALKTLGDLEYHARTSNPPKLSANKLLAGGVQELVKGIPNQASKEQFGKFKSSANLLGLLQKAPEDWFKGNASEGDQAEFDAIALRREVARAAKDWAAADAARDEATAKGIVLEDKPDGSTEWRKT
jgi:cysteinyl-tRNA synthetase